MAARPYTHTFVRSYTAGAYVRWTCPSGYRAVLTNVLAAGSGAAGEVSAWIAGIPFCRIALPASFRVDSVQMRTVVYSGQELLTYITGGGISASYSGYLFEDQSGAVGPPGQLVSGHVPRVEELPTDAPPWLAELARELEARGAAAELER